MAGSDETLPDAGLFPEKGLAGDPEEAPAPLNKDEPLEEEAEPPPGPLGKPLLPPPGPEAGLADPTPELPKPRVKMAPPGEAVEPPPTGFSPPEEKLEIGAATPPDGDGLLARRFVAPPEGMGAPPKSSGAGFVFPVETKDEAGAVPPDFFESRETAFPIAGFSVSTFLVGAEAERIFGASGLLILGMLGVGTELGLVERASVLGGTPLPEGLALFPQPSSERMRNSPANNETAGL